MQLLVNGLLTDYQSRMLLQKATDESLAPVGRAIEPGTLPAETLARAFREETGLIVMPVRLTGVYYSGRGGGRLAFCFRCTMRGGDLRVAEGAPPAGFFDSAVLPRGLSPAHRQRVDGALHHAGGPPLLEREPGGLGAWLGRLIGRSEPVDSPVTWRVGVRLVDSVDDGEVAMTVVDEVSDVTHVQPGEAPWETAARLLGATSTGQDGPPIRLAGVEIASDRPSLALAFAHRSSVIPD